MLPGELERHAEEMRQLGYDVELRQDGQRVYVLFKNFPLGPKYRPSASELIVYTTLQYPSAGFDMFWVVPDVRLANGGVPQSAEAVENYLGRDWRRFSWHLNRPWNPARDSLQSWISTIEERLHRGV